MLKNEYNLPFTDSNLLDICNIHPITMGYLEKCVYLVNTTNNICISLSFEFIEFIENL